MNHITMTQATSVGPMVTAESASLVVSFPHAGGSAAFFYPWTSRLLGAVRIASVQYPGRGRRASEPPCTTMPSLLAGLGGEVDRLLNRGSGPVAFWGHSLGAMVAFELASNLARDRGWSPAHLFLSACPPPHRRGDHRKARLPDDALIRAMGEIDPQTEVVLEDPRVRAYALPLLRADLAVFETYVPSSAPPLSCDITVFGGRDDVLAPVERLDGWQFWTRGRVRTVMFDGGHFFVRAHQESIVRHMTEALTWPE